LGAEAVVVILGAEAGGAVTAGRRMAMVWLVFAVGPSVANGADAAVAVD